MILQTLNSYYLRKAAESDSTIPMPGTSVEKISYALILSEQGELIDIEPLLVPSGKKLVPLLLTVPAAVKRSRGISSNFLWDTTTYVLGVDDNDNQERTASCHQAFIDLIEEFCDLNDPELNAIHLFLKKDWQFLKERADWEEICGTNMVFRMSGVPGFIHQRPAALNAWALCRTRDTDETLGQCLINGKAHQPLARLHSSIKGVRGAQSSGASLVAFNQKSFESYGKTQSYNAPVSQQVVFCYTTALNFLLRKESRQKIIIGDTTVVFWAAKQTPAEDFFADILAPPVKSKKTGTDQTEDDQKTSLLLHDLFEAVRDGKAPENIMPQLDSAVEFYILGLSPNAARLSIRFWEVNTLGSLFEKIGLHFRQMQIVRQFDNDMEFPPLWLLLAKIAVLGKGENVSPVLAGGMTKALLGGEKVRYPHTLLTAVLGRIRAEQKVDYYRAALLKAYLIRNIQMEVSMSLDPKRTETAYLLGRLFAVLEKAQNDAIPGSNSTIKDRYFAAAPATPARIFPLLLKNSANHLAKLRKDPEKKGWGVNLEKQIQQIINNINEFPATLSPEKQGLFMIGYYHQMQDFYTKKEI
ncbi:type I-C CRISPR-associated protein Cas8c/Csd1 [Desulforhopalus vacuolatus]|uniref:type I-C CRISPR-associated protein Cas8c/Csd1 n=1 Tax=Desulforhopalus vacuolatus TaxID=40414 RepID=UPI0019669592|nr:type I-C CRISPR-associated protein Cas8c/Csd1 [Desulforhopalus vacuolatus]MBM9519190.1 type I-C CRISPR-associated protein Cas8c/Csd1 [Desulforhopalus vacuolatus]